MEGFHMSAGLALEVVRGWPLRVILFKEVFVSEENLAFGDVKSVNI